ncbi:RNA-directed DNA polymerase, eukaryota, reverse transcriptase zinc-binding domain protein [Tanacetum coccineum]
MLRRSNRKIKLPLKLADSVCSWNKETINKADMEEFAESDEIEDCIQEMDEINDVREQVTVNTSMEESQNVNEMNVNVKLNVSNQNIQEMNVNDKSNVSTLINDSNVKNCFETMAKDQGINRSNNLEENISKKIDHAVNIDNDAKINSDRKGLGNSLLFVLTELIETDREVVVFDAGLVKLGSRKWMNTLCGYFVGCNMVLSKLRYNVRRMWSKCGLRDVLPHSSVFLFKFSKYEGLQFMLENSPWIINGKPLIVQTWQPRVTDIQEKDKIEAKTTKPSTRTERA